jgi:hypothetical protein
MGVVASSCSGVIEEEDGEGPLSSLGGSGMTVAQRYVTVGEVWSAGSVPLCKEDADATVLLTRLEPMRVRGDVRLVGVAVRTTLWGDPDGPSDMDTHMVGLSPGVPAGLRSPPGYEVPTSCDSSSDPVGEVVVTLAKTGPRGGSLDGLLLEYQVDGQLHRFELRFGVGLCGTGHVRGCDP